MDFDLNALAPYVATSIASWLVALKGFALACAALFLAERLWPAERNQPFANIAFNIRWAVVYNLMTALLAPAIAFATVLGIRAAGAKGLISFDFEAGSVWWLASPILYLLLYDAFYYWFHRLQHTVPVLWEQHKLHHADESVNATTQARHHWSEMLFRVPIIFVPYAVLFDITPATTGLLAFLAAHWTFFKHANLRLAMGRFSVLFVGPQVHRIHHSRLPEHQDKNFAAYFPIYDVLFKTYYHPHAQEYAPTGLSSGERIESVRGAFFLPFSGWARMVKQRIRRARTTTR